MYAAADELLLYVLADAMNAAVARDADLMRGVRRAKLSRALQGRPFAKSSTTYVSVQTV